jgi:C4-dicarboxylate-binding protein DctP
MRQRPHSLVTASVGALVGLAFTAGAALAEVEIRFPFETPPGHIKTRTAEHFKEVLEAATDGHYQVSLFPAGQLMSPADELAALARGQIEMAAPYLPYYPSIDSAWQVLTLPMLFEGYDHFSASLDGDIGADLLARLEQRGIQGQLFWLEMPMHLYMKQPIDSQEDLQGLKVRIAPNEMASRSLELLGAAPQGIPGPELYVSIQQGVVDGALTTPNFFLLFNINEVARHETKIFFGFGGYGVAFNKRWWDRQDPEHQRAIAAALEEARAFNHREIESDLALIDQQLVEGGMTLHVLDAGERARWVEMIQPLYDDLDDELRGYVERVRALSGG